MHIALMGPPGAGKTFQGQAIARQEHVPFIDVSDLLHLEATQDTPQGHLIADCMHRGDLVPPEVSGAVVDARISQPDARQGFVLSGYGRDKADAEHLVKWASHANIHDLAFVGLRVPDAEVIRRLSSRGRADDKPDVVAHRLDVYRHQTMPVIDYLTRHGLYQEIEGTGTPDDVQQRLLSRIHNPATPEAPGPQVW